MPVSEKEIFSTFSLTVNNDSLESDGACTQNTSLHAFFLSLVSLPGAAHICSSNAHAFGSRVETNHSARML